MTHASKPHQSHLTFLDAVRAYELNAERKYMPASALRGVSCRQLEVGVQTQRLSELGYAISAL